jgi:arylsulfatase A
MKPAILLLAFALRLILQIADATEHPQDTSPDDPLNLVILFADNLGYDEVSCFQSQEAAAKHSSPSTPHIDRLAGEGMKFTNWNSAAALCSASRSALLTGKYPVRTGTYPRVFRNDATFGLLPEETTLAELLKVEGYATSIV